MFLLHVELLPQKGVEKAGNEIKSVPAETFVGALRKGKFLFTHSGNIEIGIHFINSLSRRFTQEDCQLKW